jgi:hypothetical protein
MLITGALVLLLGVAGAFAFLGQNDAASAGEPAGSVPVSETSLLGSLLAPDKQEILADGKVTRLEYIAATSAAVACIRAAGVPVLDPQWEGDRLVYTGGPFPSRAAVEEARPVLDGCYDEHLRGIDIVWANQ